MNEEIEALFEKADLIAQAEAFLEAGRGYLQSRRDAKDVQY